MNRPRPLALALGVPATAFLRDLAFLLEAGEHPVEVVLLDAHLRSELRDRDAGLALHEGESLGRPRATAFAAPGTTASGRTTGFAGRFRGGSRCRFSFGAADRAARTPRTAAPRSSRRGGRAPHAVERGGRSFQATVLVYKRLQLFQP